MKKYIVFIVLAFVYGACKNTHFTNPERNPNQLAKQFFQLDPSKDTNFYSQLGTRIRIPAGALIAKGKIQIEFREALTPFDIMQAGLTTQSNGKWLSSGGMVYFNATADGGVTFQKPVEITVPSKNYDEDMQLFKGDSTDEGINWIDPKPLEESPSEKVIAVGKELFLANCASCHKVDKDLTGPALAGVQNRWSKKWLFWFTRNNLTVRAAGHPYAIALYEKYNKSAMNTFPSLSDTALEAMYTYIAAASNTKLTYAPDDRALDAMEHRYNCIDSCKNYFDKINQLNWERDELIEENSEEAPAVNIVDDLRDAQIARDTGGLPIKVSPLSPSPIYYQFNINSNGWYNIDKFLDDNHFVNVMLKVELTGEEVENKSIYLMVPEFKIMQAGGYLEDKKLFGFHENKGNTPLPINNSAFVIVFGDKDGKSYFGISHFIIKPDQKIVVHVKETTKEIMDAKMKELNFAEFEFELKDTKNKNKIIDVDQKIKDAKKLAPVDCDCEHLWPYKV
jgi:mono/diheme cytochrome c family protein